MRPPRPGPQLAPPPARKGIWFPLVLGFLLLLAVPGMVFLALSLFGKENAVNGWMKDTFHLTYHIPVPWWAALILLLMPFLILLLYFLKMKRRPIQVPSTFLWKKSIEDIHVNSLFQWMRDNVLLLIQLLVVLLLIYGVLALQAYAAQGSGQHYILLIDSSASMAVADADGGTRLDAARNAALHAIDSYGQGDVGMVIEFNSGAEIRQKYTTDIEALKRAVKAIQQTNRATHIEEALNLAGSRANPTKSTANQAVIPEGVEAGKERTYVDVQLESVPAEVHLFSDGRFADVPDFAAGNLTIQYHRMGTEDQSDNVGIVAFTAEHDDRAGGLRVFLRVLNFRPQGAHVQLKLDEMEWTEEKRLRVVDSHIKAIDLGPLTVAADAGPKGAPARNPGEEDVTFALPDPGEGSNRILRASLVDNKDLFPADDVAWLSAGAVRKAHVLVVTEDNDILEKFFGLDTTKKVAVVTFTKPAEYQTAYLRPAQTGAYDLVVFDRFHPDDAEQMPSADTYFIDDLPPPWKRPEKADLQETRAINPTSKHPLLEGTTGLDEIRFFEAFRFELDPDRYGSIGLKELQTLLNDPAAAMPAKVKDDASLQEDLFKKYDLDNDGSLNRGEFKRLWAELGKQADPKAARPDPDELYNKVDTDKTPPPPPRVPRLLETRGGGAVLFALPRGGFTDLVQTFPLIDEKGQWATDWMSHYSFPKFLRNVVHQLGGVSDAATEGTLQPGQMKDIRPEAAGKDLGPAATGPDHIDVWDEARQVSRAAAPGPSNDFLYTDTDDIGVYLATWKDGRRSFAVNLLDENESDVRPRDEIKVGAANLQATAAPYHGEPMDLWPFAAVAALLLLLVEWLLYHLRVFSSTAARGDETRRPAPGITCGLPFPSPSRKESAHAHIHSPPVAGRGPAGLLRRLSAERDVAARFERLRLHRRQEQGRALPLRPGEEGAARPGREGRRPRLAGRQHRRQTHRRRPAHQGRQHRLHRSGRLRPRRQGAAPLPENEVDGRPRARRGHAAGVLDPGQGKAAAGDRRHDGVLRPQDEERHPAGRHPCHVPQHADPPRRQGGSWPPGTKSARCTSSIGTARSRTFGRRPRTRSRATRRTRWGAWSCSR